MPDDIDGRRQELGEFIRAQRSSHRLSLRRLSDVSGISNPYLSQIERGLRKPSAEVLQRIARALAVPTEELYVRAGILESAADGDLVGHILRDPTLSDDQKGALVELYLKYRADGGGEDRAPG
ncbi:MAG: helix-turn-helix domain-containing protein [Acidimicrobiales bacterium]|nr:helix-turn-helix domain-containing protein [Actinomycetota bacterium]